MWGDNMEMVKAVLALSGPTAFVAAEVAQEAGTQVPVWLDQGVAMAGIVGFAALVRMIAHGKLVPERTVRRIVSSVMDELEKR